ncbi:putative cytochrome c oxidase subunit 6b-like [Primulina huaijiensis]|uniref:putative cytochrome c oxidase subunit 6b-like n=1 Tax=Primulina huaijiensis TaxID=1492673 RepID=UPI003CC74EF3
MSTASVMEPHDRMRARDVNKVTRGDQAPSPPQQSPPVSRAPPPSSTNPKVMNKSDASQALSEVETASSRMRRCYDSYFDYHKCVKEKGSEAEECKKVADYYKSMCPEWIHQWSIKEN